MQIPVTGSRKDDMIEVLQSSTVVVVEVPKKEMRHGPETGIY